MAGHGPRYRILRRLGQGGMAEVFEAELVGELGFSRRVALKRMFAAAAADIGAARRFIDEARIASRLHHANIVSVLDVGVLDDLPFQILEYVDGVDAHQLAKRAGGTLPLEVALAIAGGVAHALDHAHAATDEAGLPLGIVHRDVKPSNVLVSLGGDIKLGDFGIAVARDRSIATEAGIAVGTLGFIAPEQRTRGELDGRTDVFSLGLTLHALLTGATPLADHAVELRVLAGEPVPLAPNLPADIRALLATALDPDRRRRPTAAALADAIGAALAPRLARDDRSVIRDFIASHTGRPAARVGALDAFLGVDVVPEVDDHPDGVRHYATVARPAEVVPTAETVTRRERPARPAPPRRRAVPIAIAGLVVGAGALGAWQLAKTGPDDSAAVRMSDNMGSERMSDADSVDVGSASSDATVAVRRPDNMRPDAAPDAAPDARTSVVLDAAPGRRDATAVDAHVTLDAPTAPAEKGYLVVAGDESLIGAKVFVDGKFADFVPNFIEVGVGRHRVEVERPDGTRLPAKDVDIANTNTRKRPAHPRW